MNSNVQINYLKQLFQKYLSSCKIIAKVPIKLSVSLVALLKIIRSL